MTIRRDLTIPHGFDSVPAGCRLRAGRLLTTRVRDVANRAGALMEMETLGIERIQTHGEKAAAYMADAYARVRCAPAEHCGV